MKTLTRPSGILFDLGDTLLRTVSFDLESGVRRLLALTDQGKAADYDEIRRIGDLLGKSSEQVRLEYNYEVSFEVFHRNLYDRLGLTCSLGWVDLEKEFFVHSLVVECFEGLANTLSFLQTKGIKMGVVSNSSNNGETLMWLLRENGVSHYFDFLISSADYGFRKPHPEIFETAIARLGLPREDVWFIGDKLEADVIGAQGVGLTAIWFNVDNKPSTEITPDLMVKSWAEFEHIIDQL